MDSDQELIDYLSNSGQVLVSLHSEFKICKGLRNLRAKETTIFDKPSYAVDVSNRERIKSLLSEMEKDERLIYDELGGLLQDGYGLAQRLKTKHVTVPDVQKWIAEQITSLRARQASLKNLAREFIEKI